MIAIIKFLELGYRLFTFQALSLMREAMTEHFDRDAYKRLVLILSDAKMV